MNETYWVRAALTLGDDYPHGRPFGELQAVPLRPQASRMLPTQAANDEHPCHDLSVEGGITWTRAQS